MSKPKERLRLTVSIVCDRDIVELRAREIHRHLWETARLMAHPSHSIEYKTEVVAPKKVRKNKK